MMQKGGDVVMISVELGRRVRDATIGMTHAELDKLFKSSITARTHRMFKDPEETP